MEESDSIQTVLPSYAQRLEEALRDRSQAMRKCVFFDPVPSAALQPIVDLATIKTFAAGDSLTLEGDVMKSFYVVLFGTATAYYHHREVGLIRSGECIGETMFFANENLSRSASVIANGDMIVAEIRKEGIEQLQGEARSYMDKALLLALFRKLQSANRKIDELLL